MGILSFSQSTILPLARIYLEFTIASGYSPGDPFLHSEQQHIYY